jgi:hypothetical protein
MNGAHPMPVAVRPAIPAALPRLAASRRGHDRIVRWTATAVTVISAAVAIMVVALTAVVLGIT